MNKAVTKRVAMHGTGREYLRRLSADIRRDRWLYALLVPGVVYFLVFKYLPMWGVVMAFEEFNFKLGIGASPWIGLQNFDQLLTSGKFATVFVNSFVLSITRFLITFPIPILLALMLNEMRIKFIKRTTQTLMYLPHFISWVVLGSIATNFLSVTDGLINDIIAALGGTKINFLGSAQWFRTVIIGTNIWKEAGWGMTNHLAGLTAINPEYYEAATVDGANRWQTLWKVTIPNVMPSITICTFLTLTNSFKLFDQNLALTGGQPYIIQSDGSAIKTTEMLALNIYNTFYGQNVNSRGTAQAKAVLFFLLVAAIGLIQLRATRKKEVQQ